MNTLRYMWLTVKHKAFVFRAGLRTDAPLWRLIIHDWSKFTPIEAPHYGRQFFGRADDSLGFSRAWLHHQHHNPHHWEHWIPVTGHNRGGYDDLEPLPMPEWAVREMVADWLGASRAYEGRWPESSQTWPWFLESWPSIAPRLHPGTKALVELVIAEAFRTNHRPQQKN